MIVPLPLIDQLYESILDEGPLYILVEPGQILLLPIMEQIGEGFTVITKLLALPGQVACGLPPIFNGVTVMVAVTSVEPVLIAANGRMLPDPLAASPMEVVLFVQVKLVALVPVKVIIVVAIPLHTVWLPGATTTVGI